MRSFAVHNILMSTAQLLAWSNEQHQHRSVVW